MQRRGFLAALAAGLVSALPEGVFPGTVRAQSAGQGAAGSSLHASSANEFPEGATIILVHGAWADGSCWRNVILPLEQRGLHVVCAPIPLTSLTEDATVLRWMLERTTGPVVLVGHAYSGAVIAAVPDDRVKSLVYITALAPDEGETVAKAFYRYPNSPEAPKMAPDSHGLIWIPDDGFSRAVAHKASPGEAKIAAAVQRPLGVKCIQEPAPAPTWKVKPAWYLIAEEDRMISPQNQRFMADRMHAKIHSHPVDHTPMYSDPQVVIDVILEAAHQTLS
jgi:pimeloyl-ACP methyl ester carboxylesterase